MNIAELCNRDVVVTNKDSNVVEVAQLMRELHVGDVIVTEERNGKPIPVGIVTDRDLVVGIIAKQVPTEACTAGDIMSYELVTAKEHDGVWETLQSMRERGIRRMPVVDNDNVLVGIICADDFVEYLAEQTNDLVNLMRREQRREKTTRR